MDEFEEKLKIEEVVQKELKDIPVYMSIECIIEHAIEIQETFPHFL